MKSVFETKKLVDAQVSEDKTIVFANSASANTIVNLDYPLVPSGDRCKLQINNPSTISDITVKIKSKALSFGGITRYCLLETVVIPKSSTISGEIIDCYEKIIEGLFVGGDVRLTISNNSDLGASGGFTGNVRLLRV